MLSRKRFPKIVKRRPVVKAVKIAVEQTVFAFLKSCAPMITRHAVRPRALVRRNGAFAKGRNLLKE